MPRITPLPDIDPRYHHQAMNGMNGSPLTADIENGSGAATTMSAGATGGDSSPRSGIPATTLPVECKSVRPTNVAPDADTLASNSVSPGMGTNTGNAGRSTDVDVGEGGIANTRSGVQADRRPSGVGRARGPVRPVGFEGNTAKLKARLLSKGADETVVELCDEVFKNGVTIEALEERMTREQCEGLGVRDGKQFRQFLETAGRANGRMAHRCRLCPRGKEYKNHRDALRHLLKDHFGLSFNCEVW
jgi:hypothetical protein